MLMFGHVEKIAGLGEEEVQKICKGKDAIAAVHGEHEQSPLIASHPDSQAHKNKKNIHSKEEGDRAIFWSFKQGVYFAYKWR